MAPLEFSPLPFPPYFSPFLPLFATPTNPLVPRTPCSLYFSLSLARFSLRFALSLALSRSLAVVLSRLCLLSFAPIRTDTDTRPRPPRGTKHEHYQKRSLWTRTPMISDAKRQHQQRSQQRTTHSHLSKWLLAFSFLSLFLFFFFPSSFYFLLFSTPL